MSDLKEYIVTLHNHDDLDDFYTDMETLRPTMYNCMPERAMECALRRPVSRNTHYFLTQEEADQIKADPRVLEIDLVPSELGLVPTPFYTQTSANWDKSAVDYVNSHRNWALYRCTLNQQLNNWGSNNTPNQSGTVNITASGKHVDVVIGDGHVDPAHPEFAVNPDGTGGSRVVQYNWFDLNPTVLGTMGGTYDYSLYVDPTYPDNDGDGISDRTADNDHGCHVAGTSCGNSQGWARDANIYNISPYGTNQNNVATTSFFDYIRVFHTTKPINPLTGRRNPTVSNHSWGYSRISTLSSLSRIAYQGTIYNGPFTVDQARSYGVMAFNNGSADYFYVSSRVASVDADIADCIAAGVVLVGAAGNNYSRGTDSTSDVNWNNYAYDSTYVTNRYYARGGTPGTAMITVGSLGSESAEYKSTFSNCGPQVDIYAPGQNIMSSVNSNSRGGTYDYRDASRYVTKYSGTSMASPQVTGVIACLLEIYPNMSPADVLAYIQKYANMNQMTDSANWPDDDLDLQGSINRILHYNRERPTDGNVFPKLNTTARPTAGQVFPRTRIYTYGPQTPAEQI